MPCRLWFYLVVLPLLFFSYSSCRSAQKQNEAQVAQTQPRQTPVKFGAEILISDLLDDLSGQRIGLVANHTSRVFDRGHLVDTLLSRGVKLVRIFSPEHGFRGNVDRGRHIGDNSDPQTGLPIVSLYGKNKKPSLEQLSGLDLVLFDLQDVGVRHYTYLSTMTYVMETCAEAGIPFWVLDRPNPNGWYVEGPVMTEGYTSFSGMHTGVPIVHGMTAGEYARMVNEEGWLANGMKVDLRVIKCQGYSHEMDWEANGRPWVAPSPNLASPQAAYLYPALVWYERTIMSVGRGTDSAFLMLGAPWLKDWAPKSPHVSQCLADEQVQFVPRVIPGKATYPKYENETCYGLIFPGRCPGKELFLVSLSLLQNWFTIHQAYHPSESFFLEGFDRWAGSPDLQEAVQGGQLDVEGMWESWQPGLESFRRVRKKHLLYP